MSSMSQKPEIRRFGEKLRSLRRGHGYSTLRLAQILGYSTHSYLNEIETGKKAPTLELVIKISNLFQVTTDSLLRDEIELNNGR